MHQVEESVERLKRSQIEGEYFKWPTESIIRTAESIEEAGEGAYVREFDGLREDGTRERFLVVFDGEGTPCGVENESFPCPPICP